MTINELKTIFKQQKENEITVDEMVDFTGLSLKELRYIYKFKDKWSQSLANNIIEIYEKNKKEPEGLKQSALFL